MMKRYCMIFSGIMVFTFTLSFPPPLFAGEGHRHDQIGHGMDKKAPAAEHVVVDPVCGMSFKPEDAADQVEYEGKTYYFCMKDDAAAFRKDPEKYLAQEKASVSRDGGQGHEHREGEHHPPKPEKGEKAHDAMEGYEHHGMHGHWMAPEQEAKKENPIAVTETSIARGRELYMGKCTICHGERGRGDGALGATLYPKPADLTGTMTRMHPDGDLFYKISKGRGIMPGWEATIPEEDRWNLVNFIRSLSQE